MKAIVVDDEKFAIDLFKSVLRMSGEELEVVGEANSLPEAVLLIKEKAPDVVFLDIEMPGYSGLQIKDFFPVPRNFDLVFITAHQQHVLDALRIEAFDYLFKPIAPDDLSKCLSRLRKSKAAKMEEDRERSKVVKETKKITINSHQGTEFINLSDILYLEASGMYCILHCTNGEVVVSKPLGEFDYLEDEKFYRVHRSYIVNTSFVKGISQRNGNEIELNNGKMLTLSRNRKDGFKAFMKTYYGL